MRKGLFEDSPPFTQLVMLLFSMVTCFLLLSLTGMLLASLIQGVPFVELMNSISGVNALQNLNLMRYMQILQHVDLFIIPAFFAAYLFSGNAIGYLCLSRTRILNDETRFAARQPLKPALWFGAVLLLMLAAMPLINLLIALNEMIVFPESMAALEQRLRFAEEVVQQTVKLFLNVDHAGGMLFNIFMIAMLPAFGEELIFRGVIQKIFVRWTGNIHVAIIVTGFLFSLFHLQFYGFFPRWILGVMFGYLMVWSGTLWLPVFAHFVNNAVAVFLSYLIHTGMISEGIEEIGANRTDIPVTIAATVICAWLLWKMYRSRMNYV